MKLRNPAPPPSPAAISPPSKLMKTACLRVLFVFVSVLQISANAAAAEPFTAVADARSGQPVVLSEQGVLIEFGAYDWGPNWGAARRKTEFSATEETASASATVTIPASGGSYTVRTVWSRPQPDTLRAEAELESRSDTPLTLSVLTIAPPGFEGGSVTVTAAGGTAETIPLPLGKRPLGEDVRSLVFRGKAGGQTEIVFDEPVEIAADKALRVVLAKERLAAGQTARAAFSVKLPGATAFAPDPSKLPDTQEGWYPFTGASPVPAESEWRMDNWLEAPAGKHGRIRAEGDKLVCNGKPVKLWGINLSYSANAPDEALAGRRADFYAALGINAVRFHKYADGDGWAGILAPGTAARFDPAALGRMDYFFAALKKRGIYVKLSPVFIIKPGEEDAARVPYLAEFEKSGGRFNPRHGALFISEELQDLIAEQLRAILTHKNPHTGLAYAEDPALAYVELYNEDSALFGGVTNVMRQSPTLRARTGARFAAWLKKKYQTAEAFHAAWGPQGLNNEILRNQNLPLDESWEEGRVYPAGNPWFFDPDNLNTTQKPFERRLLDTMLFLKELQDETYARLAKAVRETGYDGELVASNWQAGRQMSHFYNLHSDALIGTIDRHNYFGGGARGGSGPIEAASMLARPGGGSFSAGLQQVSGRPFMLSEWIHVFPNEWGVEGPAILGAYGMGLQGWDVSFPFQNRDNGTFSLSIGSDLWDAAAPQFLGIFPAVSRQVHRGDVAESPVVHTRHVHIPSLDEQKTGFSERVIQDFDIKTFDSDVFPAAALAVGRGVVAFAESFTPAAAFDLAPHRSADGALVSVTKQLRWQPGSGPRDGHIEINTPGTQAVVGFAQGRRVALADAVITTGSRFGAVYLSAQSPGGTLAGDKAVLVTAIARARNRDQRVLNDVFLAKSGTDRNARPPGTVVMEPVAAAVTLKRSGATLHILDHNGVRTGRTLPVTNGSFEINTGRDKTPYYLLTW